MTEPVRVGLVGCGHISSIYLKNAARFDAFDVVACADALPERAERGARSMGCPRCRYQRSLADPTIDVILNLTTPDAHASIAAAACRRAKASTTRSRSRLPSTMARDWWRPRGWPDCVSAPPPIPSSAAVCRPAVSLLDGGVIGQPVAATAFMLNHGHEGWHPQPDFYYQRGGGPIFDMGPYYLTALISLLGPVRRVTGSARG